ncbi:UNVERIFIED_CONTAM: hypothetical protein Sindi_0091200 [Sesamum indicum]
MSLSLYWASAFILPKEVTNEIEKKLRTFLWKGTTTSGYAKVAWKDLCRPKDEGGLRLKDISILNRALMTKKLCDIIRCDRTSIWIEWLYQGRLRDTSIWTIKEHGGSWGWRKILRLRVFLRPMVDYQIGDGMRFYLWQDPWHYLGPLSDTFPRGSRLLGLEESAKLSMVISGGEWHWLPITDFECLEITHALPTIHGGEDRIVWRFDHGQSTAQALYRLFDPPGPKVGWSSLLSGSLKIPRHLLSLWLAILGKLATTDKPWLAHLGPCTLCNEGATETHDDLFFQCRFSRQCLTAIRRMVRFSWPNRDWITDIAWASRRWRGKHIVNMSYRALLASCVYHIWKERNLRRFEHTERTHSTIALEKPTDDHIVVLEQRRNKGDLSQKVQLAKGFLEMAQVLSSNRRDELFLQLEHCCRIIAQRRSARRILQINDDHGVTHADPEVIINEFITYYQNLLGGEPDVKQAVFHIAEDKAPGPEEVILAVLDFFNMNRLLKQINTTLLTLIPMVHSPMTVGDFRPISCCNVLYKIIAKLIVQRLSVILDKLISPCQAAFVTGRSIGDNIMLAQELFTGYNQAHRPPRCALKVKIRKAYDTVEWDFLIAVMKLFGFPSTFVKWIEACVTTPSFSVGLNGKPHGFFQGARGLRQGDPLLPYLFVLVMEVLHLGLLQLIDQDELFSFHWKCDTARIFQLGFVDDLLLFCQADMNSIGVLRQDWIDLLSGRG